jgi:hypothetical protein
MAKILLNRGFVALVDDEDYERVLAAGPWFAAFRSGETVYVYRHVRKPEGTRTLQKLHRFILGIEDPKVLVDHRNGRGLNCHKRNLRFCTVSQNGANARKRAPWKSTSQFRGVSWHKRKAKWLAVIRVNYKQIYLGRFTDELDAARAYDAAARKYFGEFARTNL